MNYMPQYLFLSSLGSFLAELNEPFCTLTPSSLAHNAAQPCTGPEYASLSQAYWYAAFHNTTAIVGAGVLGLPAAMAALGYVDRLVCHIHYNSIRFASCKLFCL